MTVEPAGALTVTSAGVLALPSKLLTISGPLVAASAAGVSGFDGFGCGVSGAAGVAGVASTKSPTAELPFLVAVAATLPAGMFTVGVMLATPWSFATAEPSLVPSWANKETVEPASDFTSTGVLVLALPVRLVVITGLDSATASFSTITFTGPSTVEPSEYVTTAVAVFSPGVDVSTVPLYLAVVPAGRSLKLAIEFSAFGCSPTLTVWVFTVGGVTSAFDRSTGFSAILWKPWSIPAVPVLNIPIETFIFFNCSFVTVSGTVVVNSHT